MQITMPYYVYKDLIEKCTFFDENNNKIQINQLDYNKKYKTITLEFIKVNPDNIKKAILSN